MESNISTNVVKIDLKTILDNYTNTQFWKKKWVVYSHRDFRLEMFINKIDVEVNNIVLKIKPVGFIKTKKGNIYSSWQYKTFNVPIDHDEYTEINFSNQLEGACIEVMKDIELSYLTQYYSDYKKAQANEVKAENIIIDIAKRKLDDANIHDDDIRDAYIDKCVSDAEIPHYSIEYLTKMEYKALPSEYLYLASWFDNKKKYEEIAEKCKKVGNKIHLKIWLESRKITSQEYADNLEAEMEDIR